MHGQWSEVWDATHRSVNASEQFRFSEIGTGLFTRSEDFTLDGQCQKVKFDSKPAECSVAVSRFPGKKS